MTTDNTHTVDRLLSIKDVEEILNVSESTIRRMIKDGELPAVKVRGQLRIDESDLARYLGVSKEILP